MGDKYMKNKSNNLDVIKINLYIIFIVVLIVSIISVVVVKYKYSDNNDDEVNIDDNNKYSGIIDYTWVRRNIEFYIDNKITSGVDNMFDKYIMFDDNIISYCSYENNECKKYSYKIDDEYLYIYVDNYNSYEYKINDEVLTFYIKDEKYDSVYYFVKPLG